MYRPVPFEHNGFSQSQHSVFTEWMEEYREEYEQFSFPIRFSLTLSGDKPATIIQGSDWKFYDSPFESEEDALQFIEELGLSLHQVRKERSYYVSHSPIQFDFLPSTSSTSANDAWHRRLGTVFGYPQEEIEWFVNKDDRIEPRDRVEKGEFTPDEMAFVDLLDYNHEDSIEGYENAIESGRAVRERIEELADEWDMPILDQLAEDHYDLSRSIYAGERDYFPGEVTGFKMVFENPALDD